MKSHCAFTNCQADEHQGSGHQKSCGHVACCAACAYTGLASLAAIVTPDFSRHIDKAGNIGFRIKGRSIAPETDPPRHAA
jgi:hypothetical protein